MLFTIVQSTTRIIDFPGKLHEKLYAIIDFSGNNFQFFYILTTLIFIIIILSITILSVDYHPEVKPRKLRKIAQNDFIFLFISGIMILVLRFPTFLLPEQNPDESQWIVSAATLVNDPRFWISVNGNTSGPVNIFPLTMIYFFGGTLNYASVRLFGLVFCIIPSIVFIYLSLRELTDRHIARLSLIPLIICIAILTFPDTIGFSSEKISILLISTGVFLTVRLYSIQHLKSITLLISGIIVGLIPLAKFQSVPIGITIAVFIIYRLLTAPDKAAVHVLSFLAGVFIPFGILLVYIISHGIAKDFWILYIDNNYRYATGEIFKSKEGKYIRLLNVPWMILQIPKMNVFFIPVMILDLVLLFKIGVNKFRQKLERKDLYFLLFSFVLIFASYYSIIAPGHKFYHYILLFIFPFIFFSGFLFYIDCKYKKPVSAYITNKHLAIFIIFIISSMAFSFMMKDQFFKLIMDEKNVNQKDKVAQLIIDNSQPGERMVVWGWMNKLHVETGLIMGSRLGNMYEVIARTPNGPSYFNYLMTDFLKNKPSIFVDAVSPQSFFFNDTTKHRHEGFIPLKKYIEENYSLIRNIEGIRIYKNKRSNTTGNGWM